VYSTLQLNVCEPVKIILFYTSVALILSLKWIVHFEINFSYVLAYLKGIQDVGVFVSTVV